MRYCIALTALATALVLSLAVPEAAAQLTTGTVTGTVRDPQNLIIPGATITLINEARGTQLPDAVSGASGDFVIPNVPPATYTLQVSLTGFKTLKRGGIAVSPGDRIGLGALTMEIGGVAETVTVTSETMLLQSQSAERSFTIAPAAVENLPIANRAFTALAALTPGVTGTTRIGDRASSGGGDTNVMMDGVGVMDTGNNGIMVQLPTESIAEVKVLVSNYQAEYGRSSGLQITAVTRGGENSFHGGAYQIMRKSRWNNVSRTTILNGDTRSESQEKDLGFQIGGPIGKPGSSNKLFFFYSHEFSPRSRSGGTQRYRLPTALERAGDFSQSLDNLGNPYPYIKDPLISGTCSATNQTACFKDGGVLGRIPQNRLYPAGMKILDLYPMPTSTVPGVSYNYEGPRYQDQSITSHMPVFKVDYQPIPKLRGSFKFAGWTMTNDVIKGALPDFLDSRQYDNWIKLFAVTVNYNINPTTFVEGTWGKSRNNLAGCVQAQGNSGPTFCENGLPMNNKANLDKAGLGALPLIYPEAGVINKEYYAYAALESVKPPIWDGTRLRMVPSFSWGGRIASSPPNFPFPGYLNVNKTTDVGGSLTKIIGRHIIKTGLFNTHSYKAQQRQGWAGSIDFGNTANNPLDSGFGFANAALGVFTSFNQYSKYVEGNYIYNNTEAFIQDNWKIATKLTLDYGVRFVHQQPQYDKLGQGVNFLPDQWKPSDAPLLYAAGCAAQPCTGTNRQAKDPRTGQLLGPTSAPAIGTLVLGSGNALNGLFKSGQGSVPKTTYNWPTLAVAPRLGVAYDLTGQQRVILRGGGGMFFDRPAGNSIYSQVQNPPTLANVTMRYTTLQTMGGLTTQAAPSLNVFVLESGLPTTWNWNAGVQIGLPLSAALDVAYTGQNSYNLLEDVGINHTDFGAAFLPQNQDPTITSSLPGGAALPTDNLRPFRGYGGITQYLPRGWFTSHTLQFSITRRFTRGLSFGFNDTIMLQQKGSTTARIKHNPDGSWNYMSDQAQADELLGNYIPTRHYFKGNFVWNLPGYKGGTGAGRVLGWISKDWTLSGIYTANTGGAYSVGYNFQNGASGSQNTTGSNSYSGRIRLLGDAGGGCRYDNTYSQFNTAAFGPPQPGSLGLESGVDYLRGCFYQAVDLAILRDIRLGERRTIEIRLDAFNALNEARITGRASTASFASQTDASIVNLPFDASGNLIATRSQPKNAGFGVVNGYQGPRNLQLQIRFRF